jgi:protein-disulfide isomerase
MKRSLPFIIILSILLIALGVGAFFLRHRDDKIAHSLGKTGPRGAEPPHVRGHPGAPAALEEFGDFECLPCFILWPALRNLEKDYGDRLSLTFRQCPLPQHRHAVAAARASEAAGRQGHFWEMYDTLYLSRAQWIHAGDPRPVFDRFAGRLGLDVTRFNRDMDGPEVAQRLAADDALVKSLGIDRTPVLFLNGQRLRLRDPLEENIRADIEAALARQSQ